MSPQSFGHLDRKDRQEGAAQADLDAAEADAIMQRYREWAAAGRPGAVSHQEVMAELLGGR